MELKKLFNLRTASLVYALLISISFHLWDYCDSYNDLPSQDIFLLLIIVLYAAPTLIYSILVVRHGVKWRFLQPVWAKVCVVCLVSVLVAAAVYSLYNWYPELNYWVHRVSDNDEHYWHNEFTNQYLDYQRGHPALRSMQWKLLYSHITAIALALLVFFRLKRFQNLEEEDKTPITKSLIGLTVYFLLLGYLLFNYATIVVVPYLMLIYVINCTDFFVNHPIGDKNNAVVKLFFTVSILSLIVLSYFLSRINEESSVLIAFVYMVIAFIALVVGSIAGLVSKSNHKTYLAGAVWGFSFALTILSLVIALAMLYFLVPV